MRRISFGHSTERVRGFCTPLSLRSGLGLGLVLLALAVLAIGLGLRSVNEARSPADDPSLRWLVGTTPYYTVPRPSFSPGYEAPTDVSLEDDQELAYTLYFVVPDLIRNPCAGGSSPDMLTDGFTCIGQ